MQKIMIHQELSSHEQNLLRAADGIYTIHRLWRSKIHASNRSPEDNRLRAQANEFAELHRYELVDLRFRAFDDPHILDMFCTELHMIEQSLMRNPGRFRELRYTTYLIHHFARKDPPNSIYVRWVKFRNNPVISNLYKQDDRRRSKAWRSKNPERYREIVRVSCAKYRAKCATTDSEEAKQRKRENARLRKQKSRARARLDYDSMI